MKSVSLRYIIGKPGTGKSYTCAKEIAATQNTQNAQRGNSLIYIVPEQFSLSAESLLLEHTSGLFAAQVLSFNRLTVSVLKEAGRGGRTALCDIGKHLIIRQVLGKLAGGLRYYKSQKTLLSKGFAEKIAGILTEFHQYGIVPSSLREAAEQKDNSSYALRLLDLSDIFDEYLKSISARFDTADTALDMLAERIPDSEFFRGAEVWLDGFKSFTPQEYRVIAALLRTCARVNIALTLDIAEFNGYFETISPYESFFEVKTTVNKLSRLVEENMANFGIHTILTENHRHKHSPSLQFLADNYHRGDTIFTDSTENIVFSRHQSLYNELSRAAGEITRLVREKGCKWDEIGIICSDLQLYGTAMRTVFPKHGIKLFIDDRRSLLAHPLAEICRGYLAIRSRGMTYENVFRSLKTGLLGFSDEEVDILENYVLATGIKGKMWEKEWHWVLEGDEEMTERVNVLRARFVETMAPHLASGRGRRQAKVICEALYRFLDGCGVKENFTMWVEESAEMPEKAQTHAQMWARLIEILDITVQLFGEELLTYAEFAALLEAGFQSVSAGLAPPSLEHVTAGDISRSRLTNVRALFVLGCNDRLIPARREEGLLPDSDREILKEAGVTLAGSLKRRTLDERFNIYQAILKPSEVLYLSCLSEEAMSRPAYFVNDILAKFPGHKVLDSADDSAKIPPEIPMRNESLSDFALSALYGASGKRRLNITVSKLENYRLCPFMYFSRNVLKLRERRLYQIENHDVGNILHHVLERFTHSLMGGRIEKNELNAAVTRIVEDTAAEFVNAILLSGERYIHYKERLRAMASRSAEVMAEHLARSDFSVAAVEMPFGGESFVFNMGGVGEIALAGRIDRVDKADARGRKLVTVIDYKTGSREFSFADCWYGLQLQLAVYLMAALAQEPESEAAGLMYFKVANPVVDYFDGLTEESVEQELFGSFRMDGTVSSDLEIIRSMDRLAERGDILPINLTSSGEVSKRSNALDRDGFGALIDMAAARIKEIGAGILSGDVSAHPLKHKNRLPCRFCEYPAICGRGNDDIFTRQTAKLSEKDALGLILENFHHKGHKGAQNGKT